ncbi:hypothetical protein CYLTODRAFT_358151 [Cylindrobasidium torrendii FP15055 ss-10]|uniref:Geranylgeranyl pyrophosphate synthetase n=1 Tax=Cylindrobasidium torrendii FP15055 ss-10 TaxID=1314674 RepID=A0A0D7B4Z8_9AGAR|nr:hypothetical protein CYLTODRAFT_358151 [Cylindrobasidium torrendii FP15055 ss-10]
MYTDVLQQVTPDIIPPRPSTALGEPHISIENFKTIGSYSWQRTASKPTILVPGAPRIWTEPSLPLQVPADVNNPTIDKREYRLAKMYLLPIMLAVPQTFEWPSVDILTDRWALRRLLGWAGGGGREDFRIDIDLAGADTLILSPPIGTPIRMDPRSVGVGFEHATTTAPPGEENSVPGQYHRVAAYDMGGLHCVVRFEVDASLQATEPNSGHSASRTLEILKTPLLDAFYDDIACITPAEDLIELKTKSLRQDGGGHLGPWGPRYEQMFLGQIPALYLGIHQGGIFHDISKYSKEELAMAHEEQSQPGLRKMVDALVDVRGLVKRRVLEGHGTTFSLICVQKELKLYKRRGEGVLPDEFLAYFSVGVFT